MEKSTGKPIVPVRTSNGYGPVRYFRDVMRNVRNALYEVLFSAWPVGVRGKTRWLNFLTAVLRIEPYGYWKYMRMGIYRLRLDPGDRNDRYYFFGMIPRVYGDIARALLKEGDAVLDVGANVGHFSALSAAVVGKSGKVYAIEANPVLFDRLSSMAAEVSGGPISAHHAAVWSRPGSMPFYLATETGWSSLRENPTFDTDRVVTVEAVTIDRFVAREKIPHIALLKLDIEGAETDALLGARECIRIGGIDHILLEAEPNRLMAFERSGQEIAELMDAYGFVPVAFIKGNRLYAACGQKEVPGTFNGDYLYCRRPLLDRTRAAVLHE